MGIGSAFKSAVSSFTSSVGDTLRPVQQATLALPGIAAQGQNYLLQSSIAGVGQALQNPSLLSSVAGAVGTGGVSTLTQAGSAGLGGLFSSLLGQGAGQTQAPVVNTSGGYGAGTPAPAMSGMPSWVIPAAIAGGVGLIVLVIAMRK